MDFLKSMKRRTTVSAILYMVAGMILILFPQTTAQTICLAVAVVTAAVGLMYLLSFYRGYKMGAPIYSDLTNGCLAALFSLFAFVKSDVLISVIPVILGFAVVINGILKLGTAMELRSAQGNRWVYFLVCTVLQTVVGVFLLLDPFDAAAGLIMFFGIALLFSGFTDLISVFLIKKD